MTRPSWASSDEASAIDEGECVGQWCGPETGALILVLAVVHICAAKIVVGSKNSGRCKQQYVGRLIVQLHVGELHLRMARALRPERLAS